MYFAAARLVVFSDCQLSSSDVIAPATSEALKMMVRSLQQKCWEGNGHFIVSNELHTVLLLELK